MGLATRLCVQLSPRHRAAPTSISNLPTHLQASMESSVVRSLVKIPGLHSFTFPPSLAFVYVQYVILQNAQEEALRILQSVFANLNETGHIYEGGEC